MPRTPNVPDPEDLDRDRGEVIGLYDADGTTPTYVVADVTSDGRWLSMPAEAAPSLDEWE